MMAGAGRIAHLAACFVVLPSCGQSEQKSTAQEEAVFSVPEIIETQWTEAAAKRTETLSDAKKITYALPELRIYDRRQRLIFHQSGIKPGTVAQTIQSAIEEGRPTPGPQYANTVADLEAVGEGGLTTLVQPNDAITIFDYWATWCVPCKILEKQMLAWAAQQPPGFVRIVRVEADLTKLQRAKGEKVYMLKKGADGKLIKVEMK